MTNSWIYCNSNEKQPAFTRDERATLLQ